MAFRGAGCQKMHPVWKQMKQAGKGERLIRAGHVRDTPFVSVPKLRKARRLGPAGLLI